MNVAVSASFVEVSRKEGFRHFQVKGDNGKTGMYERWSKSQKMRIAAPGEVEKGTGALAAASDVGKRCCHCPCSAVPRHALQGKSRSLSDVEHGAPARESAMPDNLAVFVLASVFRAHALLTDARGTAR